MAGKVKQITLLNLGRHFDVNQDHWPALCARIEELLQGQAPLAPVECPSPVERHAQRIAAQLIARGQTSPAVETSASGAKEGNGDIQSVDVDSMARVRPRTVGVESLGLWAMGLSALYRASDRLLTHKAALEAALFKRVNDLFGLSTTVTLYDLTNTYFEGEMAENAKAQRGHSKEKRTDCPLVTLGLVLDGSGFVRRSEVFEGNVSEGKTLEAMLEGLGAPNGALIVMGPWHSHRGEPGLAEGAGLSLPGGQPRTHAALRSRAGCLHPECSR